MCVAMPRNHLEKPKAAFVSVFCDLVGCSETQVVSIKTLEAGTCRAGSISGRWCATLGRGVCVRSDVVESSRKT